MCFFYVDDVMAMSESADELQSLLDAVDGYGREFGVRFSSNKSKIMIVNEWMIGLRHNYKDEATCIPVDH